MNARESWDRLYGGDDRPWKGGTDAELPFEGMVLELGVGNGKGLTALSPRAGPIGLDFSLPALLSCRRWRSLPMVLGDVTALPFREASLPSVTASHVLGHLPCEGRSKAVREIVRVLVDGGLVYVNVFGEEDMRCGEGKEVEERTFERGNGIICHYFQQDEVAALFSDLRVQREWERRVPKRYNGRDRVRHERRVLLRK